MGFLVDLIPWLGKKFGIAALENFSLSDDVTKFICLGALALVVVLFVLHVVGKGVGKKEGNAKYAASVSKYLQDNGEVNEGNLAPFTDTCFGEKAPAAYKEGWAAFVDSRFGYPSECFDKAKCVKPVRTKKSVKAKGFLAASAVLFAVAAGFATNYTRAAVAFAIPVVALVCYWIVCARAFKLDQKLSAEEEAAFDALMEDLDANVALQQYFDYQRDTSDLSELSDAINEIADFENNKPDVQPAPVEETEEAPAEEEENLFADEEEATAEPVEEVEEVEEEAPVEETVEETADEEVTEEAPVEEEIVEEPAEEEIAEPAEEEVPASTVEEAVEEAPAEEVAQEAQEEVVEEAPAPTPEEIKNAQIFKPFMTVLNKTLKKGYNRATLKKVAQIAILAYKKFDKPEQREEIKDFIRKF
ncbi:MAG TPA: hypothetical protein DEQ88_02585, partial [Clostridiales bacterium]|nr:hypothetical protein [Clostridiales bacterium]